MPPAPKAASKRRNRGTPKSYGAAEPVVDGQGDGQPDLGFEAHDLVTDMWSALANSVESKYFSAADWQRARWELWFANDTIRGGEVTASRWAQVQQGLSALLVSPADKRRAGIELKKAAVDPDAEAAVAQLDEYRTLLQSG